MKILLSCLLCLSVAATAQAEIIAKEVNYTSGGTALKGYLAYDDSIKGKRPGILVVHEWWGHNDHARNRARMLAELGYTALAVDMYGDGKTADHPKQAGEFMHAAFQDWEGSKAKFNEAMKLLQSQATVDPEKIASIGFCFGGAVSLRMARGGAKLAGVVAFHSALPTEPPVTPGSVQAAVLVINGSEDSFLQPEQVGAFTKEMVAAIADFTYISLAGVKHSYTNPRADEFSQKFNLPNLQYDKSADARSWLAMQQFFHRIFAP
ncbi:MAG: dienelactone hydrolase [Nitrospinae bacterium CG11_big_fil_rev_8_21_14_0_20_56_8]|nr:MAG: dienelactone hydrolase [Nitrospinae bacterium CG11_big_fil_rev_8_21_14_0_20_56_8]